MEAIREAGTQSRKPLGKRTAIGTAMLIAGVAAASIGAALGEGNAPALVGIGAALVIIAAILVSAWLIVPVARRLIPVFRGLFGHNGKLALTNAAREPRRTANTAGALMIGVVLLSLITTFGASIKGTVAEMLTGQTRAHFIVSGGLQDSFAPISADDVAAMERVDGVDTVHFFGVTQAVVDGQATNVVGIDAETAEAAFNYDSEPGLSQIDGGVYVQPMVLDQGYEVGDTITITRQEQSLQVEITGTYHQEGDPPYWLDWEQAQQLHDGMAAIATYVVATDGADLDLVQTRLERILEDSPRLTVQTTDEYGQEINQFLDVLLYTLAAMLAMALVIAVAGVANTLSLSVTERTREIGLLRAVGLDRKAVRRIVTIESVFIALYGAVAGLVIGVGLGWALVHSLADVGFETFIIPWVELLIYALLAFLAGIVAALAPARRASKLNVLEAIATE